MRGRHLHLLVDLACPAIQHTTKESGKTEHVVDLIRIITAPRGHDPRMARGDLGHDLRGAEPHDHAGSGRARRSHPRNDDAQVLRLLSHHFQDVDQRRSQNDRGTVLIVVKHRNSQFLTKAALDPETVWSRCTPPTNPGARQQSGVRNEKADF